MFLCRETELQKLNNRFNKNQMECVIIYGRRRVGKTTLINEFVKDKPVIYFPALNTNAKDNLTALSKAIHAYLNPDAGTALSITLLTTPLEKSPELCRPNALCLSLTNSLSCQSGQLHPVTPAASVRP